MLFFRQLPVLATVLVALTGCTLQPSALVSEPLQPLPGAEAAYLVGSIGPEDFAKSPADNQRLLFRKRGSAYGAAGVWMRGFYHTVSDVEDGKGAASVFVLKLKPGDYEFYDFQFFSSSHSPGVGTTFTSVQAREKFNVPLRLQAGKAYYLGEFRSTCALGMFCHFVWRDQSSRDRSLARRQVPNLPVMQLAPMNLKVAEPHVWMRSAPLSPLSQAEKEVRP